MHAMNPMRIRDAGNGDAAAIASIYNTYVRESVATFEIEAVSDAAMRDRIADVQARGLPWLGGKTGAVYVDTPTPVRGKPARHTREPWRPPSTLRRMPLASGSAGSCTRSW